MTDFVASVDAGNGGVNVALASFAKSGSYKTYHETAIRAAAVGGTLDTANAKVAGYTVIQWNGHSYVSGDEYLKADRRTLERHMGSNRYGNEFHQFLVAASLAKMGVKEGLIDLTLFAPPGLHNDLKGHIKSRFMEHKGEVTIQLTGDKKPRTWRYENVTVLPEGIGATCCFNINDKGEPVATSAFEGEVVLLDLGAHTLDTLKFVNGDVNPEALQYATWESGGVHVHIREPILRAIRKHNDDFSILTVDDVDRVIRLGSVSDDYALRLAGYEIDLKPLLDKYRERYAEWIANNICDGVFNNLRGIKSLILVGGGAVFVEDHLRKWYGDKLLDRKQFETTRKVHPADMNAVGGLRFALMRLKKAMPT